MPRVATQELNVFHFGFLEISVFGGWFELDPGLGMGITSHHGPKNSNNTQTHCQFANPLDYGTLNVTPLRTKTCLGMILGHLAHAPITGDSFCQPASETVSEQNLV